MHATSPESVAAIPQRLVGPIRIRGELDDEVMVPMATFETPLWPSTQRGARLSVLAGGIHTTVAADTMSRSVILQADSAATAAKCLAGIRERRPELDARVAETSRFARLQDLHAEPVGNLLYLRFAMATGDASGHNMTTKAADHLMNWILAEFPALEYVSISGNICTDKKVSAINGILGRGKRVIAELHVPRDLCEKRLKTTPEKIVDLNVKKNLIGSVLAGGTRSANAHFANMLLAVYLATGQDAANIVEGSQGITHAELRDNALAFSVTLPNLIVGTVGNGKDLDFVRDNLATLGCDGAADPGANARRLAAIVAATVLCGELSLLAAQTNRGELVRAHMAFERS